jgi:hypothetical protein
MLENILKFLMSITIPGFFAGLYFLFEKKVLSILSECISVQAPCQFLRISVLGIAGLILILSFLLVTKWKQCHSYRNLKEKFNDLAKLDKELISEIKKRDDLIESQKKLLEQNKVDILSLAEANKSLLNPPFVNNQKSRINQLADFCLSRNIQ